MDPLVEVFLPKLNFCSSKNYLKKDIKRIQEVEVHIQLGANADIIWTFDLPPSNSGK